MVWSSISSTPVKSLYTNILPLCGKGGYELMRFGGSGGMTSDEATKNLLCVLKKNSSLIPIKAGACLIKI